LSELLNCCRMKAPLVAAAICSAFAMAPFIPAEIAAVGEDCLL
jgi:hypothetical protein